MLFLSFTTLFYLLKTGVDKTTVCGSNLSHCLFLSGLGLRMALYDSIIISEKKTDDYVTETLRPAKPEILNYLAL